LASNNGIYPPPSLTYHNNFLHLLWVLHQEVKKKTSYRNDIVYNRRDSFAVFSTFQPW